MHRDTWSVVTAVPMLVVTTLACGGEGGDWNCIEYDAPLEVVRLAENRKVQIYGGVDTPSDGQVRDFL